MTSRAVPLTGAMTSPGLIAAPSVTSVPAEFYAESPIGNRRIETNAIANQSEGRGRERQARDDAGFAADDGEAGGNVAWLVKSPAQALDLRPALHARRRRRRAAAGRKACGKSGEGISEGPREAGAWHLRATGRLGNRARRSWRRSDVQSPPHGELVEPWPRTSGLALVVAATSITMRATATGWRQLGGTPRRLSPPIRLTLEPVPLEPVLVELNAQPGAVEIFDPAIRRGSGAGFPRPI